MDASFLSSLTAYSRLIAELVCSSSIKRSTVAFWSECPHTGIAEGEVFFTNGLRLRMREEVDFAARLIVSYGYEVYQGAERLYWYDDFPHPEESSLASTFPHHRHVPPLSKHHRLPVEFLSYDCPNLPAIISEIESISLITPVEAG
jgi:hypothetical protein